MSHHTYQSHHPIPPVTFLSPTFLSHLQTKFFLFSPSHTRAERKEKKEREEREREKESEVGDGAAELTSGAGGLWQRLQ
ncbi:hypothetical protein Scep_014962 [Stephania cephalantha]|uniref:Uncharacterized protein n=1 Tax=Stephania cephalantha TaxID=152367 RepID=A0AAP0P3I2_9MAGN